MPPQQLVNLIATLSPDERHAVEEFIANLKHQKPTPASPISFRSALDSFVHEHAELLRRLAE